MSELRMTFQEGNMDGKRFKKWVVPDREFYNQRGQVNVRTFLMGLGVDVGKPYTVQRDEVRRITVVTQEVEDE